ncbi:MAG: hypothetical protein AB8F94_01665 [Saprospiraceae bacterium]
MTVSQLKLFYLNNKSALLRIILLSLISWFNLFNLNAQKETSIKLKIETGILWDAVEGKIYLSGFFFNIEPKLKTSKKIFIGLRFGAAFNTQRILISDSPPFFNINASGGNGVISIVPTFDYFFTKKKIRPYLGLGFGYYFLNTSKKAFANGSSSNLLELNVNNQIGFLIRGGFNLHKLVIGRYDLSKFTIGLEWNFIPKANVEILNGQKIGTIVNSNIALSIGYIFGNAKT